MKIETKEMKLKDGIEKEWLITNGIGGYSSSTVFGINTRKYHGLLVAPLTPPARRHLILSKLDESIVIENKKYNLYSNMCRDFIASGYKYLESFEKDYIPIFTYKVNNITIKKLICMPPFTRRWSGSGRCGWCPLMCPATSEAAATRS